ncbi:MAG: EcsC family protein [Clostridiales bacterium]|nr:EcsC family protein [Clostridiales bacterium]
MNDKKQDQPGIGAFFGNVAKNVSNKVTDLAGKTTDAVAHGKTAVEQALDVNGDGKIDIEDIIILSLRIPGVRIVREDFLRTEFKKRFPQEVIDDAVLYTPAHAGIAVEEIDKITNSVIAYERNCVSGISAALGMPGGFAMAATIPTDIAQYYGFMLRAIQKMLYLYGFPQIDVEEKNQHFDSETLNIITLCLGAMYGVSGASNMLKTMANALAKGVEKQLLKRALTKGTIYPVVKSISKWFGVRMTKQMFAGFFKKAIPVVGGLIGGGITFATFKPCCDKLRDSLRNTILSNPNANVDPEEIDSFIADVNGLSE